MRSDVLKHLDTLHYVKGVEKLKGRIADGGSGESMILINACKCMHVVKNWAFLKRCPLNESYEISSFILKEMLLENSKQYRRASDSWVVFYVLFTGNWTHSSAPAQCRRV